MSIVVKMNSLRRKSTLVVAVGAAALLLIASSPQTLGDRKQSVLPQLTSKTWRLRFSSLSDNGTQHHPQIHDEIHAAIRKEEHVREDEEKNRTAVYLSRRCGLAVEGLHIVVRNGCSSYGAAVLESHIAAIVSTNYASRSLSSNLQESEAAEICHSTCFNGSTRNYILKKLFESCAHEISPKSHTLLRGCGQKGISARALPGLALFVACGFLCLFNLAGQ